MVDETRRVTIYDLAQKANTSSGTVSAVLNGTWKKRRISPALAQKILDLAAEAHFLPNMQARALRRDKSGMTGMILPMHDNRFFSSISQTFERLARARGLFPIVVSTLREPKLEVEAVRSLLSYRIESLFVVGATDPDHISALCATHGVATVNLDLPGSRATSIISDNYEGCLRLTRLTVAARQARGLPLTDTLFVGGRQNDHNTRERVRGFLYAMAAMAPQARTKVVTSGYAPETAAEAVRAYQADNGHMPSVLIVNSTIAFEGVVPVLNALPAVERQDSEIGCFDWDPFAALLDFPLHVVRQRGDRMVEQAFALMDQGRLEPVRVMHIPVEVVERA